MMWNLIILVAACAVVGMLAYCVGYVHALDRGAGRPHRWHRADCDCPQCEGLVAPPSTRWRERNTSDNRFK
jgi:hypothetical protein